MNAAHPAYYQPRPRLPRAAMLGLLGGLLPTLLLGTTLGLAEAYCDQGAATLPLALLVGVLLSLLLDNIVRHGHLRHPGYAAVIAAGLGALAWGTSWVTSRAIWVWQFGTTDWAIAEPAAWQAGRLHEEGAAALLVWLLISLPPAVRGYRRAGQPYCERLQQWLSPQQSPRQFLYIDDIEGFVRRAEGNPADLGSLFDRPAESVSRWAQASVYLCAPGYDCYLQIDNVGLRRDYRGRWRQHYRRVLAPMRISPYQAAALLSPESNPPSQTARLRRRRATL